MGHWLQCGGRLVAEIAANFESIALPRPAEHDENAAIPAIFYSRQPGTSPRARRWVSTR